ncbi:MAG: glycosyltransferase family 4 protein [Acidimicrobiales bacterium]
MTERETTDDVRFGAPADLRQQVMSSSPSRHRLVEVAIAPSLPPVLAPNLASLPAPSGASLLRAIATEGALERIRVVAWRDLDDPEAGGSERHAHQIVQRWAQAGIDVELNTSAVRGAPVTADRDGYRVVRRAGRYAVFPRTGLEGFVHRARAGEAMVEIWNGMPFLSPLWYRGPRVVFLHHVHAEMWRMVLPAWMARIGETVERRIAPPLYRASRVITLSTSAREEIVELLGLDPARVSVVPPGVDAAFSPGPGRSRSPLVVAVGRLVPVKRFDMLVRALVRAKREHPDLRAVIVGDGYERPRLESLVETLGAQRWLTLPGHLPDHEVVQWYRRAWLVASTSLREGWGMTLTEAGACETPAVATSIAGHRDAVVHGRTGLLAESEEEIGRSISALLTDGRLRRRLGMGARAHAAAFDWDLAARATLEALAEEACFAARDARDARYALDLPATLLQ